MMHAPPPSVMTTAAGRYGFGAGAGMGGIRPLSVGCGVSRLTTRVTSLNARVNQPRPSSGLVRDAAKLGLDGERSRTRTIR